MCQDDPGLRPEQLEGMGLPATQVGSRLGVAAGSVWGIFAIQIKHLNRDTEPAVRYMHLKF